VNEPIAISIAHSVSQVGAMSSDGLREYDVSKAASFAAARALSGDYHVALIDPGTTLDVVSMAHQKIATVNGLKPKLAVEIHCNASGEHKEARYSEVIHHADSPAGKALAESIAVALAVGFMTGGHQAWPRHGARPNTIAQDLHKLFFLEQTNCPSVIVEGVFISNDEQAAWLRSGGAEAYGLLVADGIRRYLARQT
jgi:N-acetylmuramoyl-L-alanine amidase